MASNSSASSLDATLEFDMEIGTGAGEDEGEASRIRVSPLVGGVAFDFLDVLVVGSGVEDEDC